MQHLKLARFSANGAYLSDEEGREVLLPRSYLTPEMTPNSLVWAFIYTDSSDRLVAITTEPKAFLGDIVALEVRDISQNGIYLDLGIPKDLFMPSKNPTSFKIAQKVVVKIAQDAQNRLIARQNIADFLHPLRHELKNKNITILPFRRTEIGLNCVVNGAYFGILHNSDMQGALEIGTKYRAIAKKVRTDGKIDIGLTININEQKGRILRILRENGELPLNFKSSSDDINKILKMSKKSFKTAANALIKEGKIKFFKDIGEGGGFRCAKSSAK